MIPRCIARSANASFEESSAASMTNLVAIRRWEARKSEYRSDRSCARTQICLAHPTQRRHGSEYTRSFDAGSRASRLSLRWTGPCVHRGPDQARLQAHSPKGGRFDFGEIEARIGARRGHQRVSIVPLLRPWVAQQVRWNRAIRGHHIRAVLFPQLSSHIGVQGKIQRPHLIPQPWR